MTLATTQSPGMMILFVRIKNRARGEPTVAHGISETDSSFRVKWRTAGKV